MKTKAPAKEIEIYFKNNQYLGKRIAKAFISSKMKNKNDFYLQILSAGLDSFWNSETEKLIDKKDIQVRLANLEEYTESIKLTNDNLFVQNEILKHLLVTLYNIQVKQLKGISISADDVEQGFHSAMPEKLQYTLDRMIEEIEVNNEPKDNL